jgi:hypothetical protein
VEAKPRSAAFNPSVAAARASRGGGAGRGGGCDEVEEASDAMLLAGINTGVEQVDVASDLEGRIAADVDPDLAETELRLSGIDMSGEDKALTLLPI